MSDNLCEIPGYCLPSPDLKPPYSSVLNTCRMHDTNLLHTSHNKLYDLWKIEQQEMELNIPVGDLPPSDPTSITHYSQGAKS